MVGRQIDAEEHAARHHTAGTLDQPTGPVDHRQIDPVDQAALFGQRDEFAGWNQAALGVAPADQSLEPGQLVVIEMDDRLEERFEFVRIDAALHILLAPQPLKG
jgi:hypothetical protein